MNRTATLALLAAVVALLVLVYFVEWEPADTTPTDIQGRWKACTGRVVPPVAIRWERVDNRVEWVDHVAQQVVVDRTRKADRLVWTSSLPHGFAHLETQRLYGDTPEHGPEFQRTLLAVEACFKRVGWPHE